MQHTARIGEIDALRGFAIVLMTIFHLIVDLKDFYNVPVEYLSGFWYYVGKLSAVLFILLSGISSTLGSDSVRRGITVLGWGMALTIVTYIYNPQTYIRFGILHLLGTSMLLAPLFAYVRLWLLIPFSISVITLGNYLARLTTAKAFLFPFGLTTNDFASIDYYPLFPWFGVFLIGIIIGRTLYANRKSIFRNRLNSNLFTILGKRSLVIYLVHQPVLLGVLFIISKLTRLI